MPWVQEEPLTTCPTPLPHVGTQTHQSSWPSTILGSSDSSCVLKKGRDAAGKEAGRVGGKDSSRVPPEQRGREGPCLPGGSERGHTQPCRLGRVTGITGSATGAAGTISAISCAVVWYRVLSESWPCRMSPVTSAKPLMCRQIVLPAPPPSLAQSSSPQHPFEDHTGILLSWGAAAQASSGGWNAGSPWAVARGCQRILMAVSLRGGGRAAMANVHLKVHEQCWRGKGWHGEGSRQGCLYVSREIKICGWKTPKLKRTCLAYTPHPFLPFVEGQ